MGTKTILIKAYILWHVIHNLFNHCHTKFFI